MQVESGYLRLLPYVLRQWHVLSTVVVLTVGASAAAALQPWPIKILVDYGLKHDPTPNILGTILGLTGLPDTAISLIVLAALSTLALFALNSILDAVLTWGWTLAGQRMVTDLSIDLFRSLQRLPLLEHYRRPVGDSLSRLNTDVWCVYSMTDGLFTPGQHAVQLLTLGVVAWHLDPHLASVTLVLSPLMAVSSFWFGRRLKARARQTRNVQSRFLSFVHQTLTAMPVVQAFSTEQANRRHLESLASDAVTLSQRGAVISSTYGLVNGLILSLGMAVILYAGGVRVLAGTLSLGSLLIFLAYVRNMQNAAAGLITTYATLKPIEASIERVVEVIEPRKQQPSGDGSFAAALHMPKCSEAGIRFENVSFHYEADVPVLCNVTVEARPGEKIAIIGPSGAGKSTLASLILRFFDPMDGRITINGIDIRDYTLESLRANIAIVLQEPFLLPVSISENIAYGRPDASREEIRAAAKAANADAFIEQLPERYETKIGERGATLSGGERQRIAIARAILKDAPILILDEPTASVDAQTEASILNALDRLMRGRTTLIIAHRPSTIRGANRVFELRNGVLVERNRAQVVAVPVAGSVGAAS